MKYLSTILSLAAIVIALGAYNGVGPKFGDVTGTTNYSNLALSGTLAVTGATTLSSTLTQSTTNTATSTFATGCIQTTATSTATPIRFVVGTSVISTTTPAGSSQGVIAWQYGSCPI